MKDLVHDHLSFGFHKGCAACKQVAESFKHQELVELPGERQLASR